MGKSKPKVNHLNAGEDETGWTPVLNGNFYCSPLCGHKCTKEAHDLAEARSRALADGMGSDWSPRVWENMGWHYEIKSKDGHWSVHASHNIFSESSYTAYLNTEGDGSGGGKWVGHGKTPQAAIKDTWKQAKAYIERMHKLWLAGMPG